MKRFLSLAVLIASFFPTLSHAAIDGYYKSRIEGFNVTVVNALGHRHAFRLYGYATVSFPEPGQGSPTLRYNLFVFPSAGSDTTNPCLAVTWKTSDLNSTSDIDSRNTSNWKALSAVAGSWESQQEYKLGDQADANGVRHMPPTIIRTNSKSDDPATLARTVITPCLQRGYQPPPKPGQEPGYHTLSFQGYSALYSWIEHHRNDIDNVSMAVRAMEDANSESIQADHSEIIIIYRQK